jgi:Tfp pilus assembly protein PilF
MASYYTSGSVQIRIGAVAARPAPASEPSSPRPIEPVLEATLAALDRGDLEGSAAVAGRALGSGREHPVLLCVMAMALQADGRCEEALPHLKRAMALEPKDVSIANALARCLISLERPQDGLPVLQTALNIDPRRAETFANIGLALERLGRLAEAECNYKRALELQPGQITAQAGLASLANHYGAYEEARAHAAQVTRAAPSYSPAVLSLAMAELALGAAVAAETRIRRLMQAPRPDPLLAGYLGDALDAQDRCAEAFQAWRRSGEALRQLRADRFAGHGVLASAERRAGALERLPAGRWPARTPDPPSDGQPAVHAFLLGFARSGTSLLGLALRGHPQVEILDEQEPLSEAIEAFSGPEGLARLLAASPSDLEGFRRAYWRRARAARAALDRRVFIDKQPINSLHLPLIARLFPDARIVFARRDPRDVVLSCFRRRFLMNRYTFELLTPEGAARLYAAAMRIADRTRRLAPLDVLELGHEDLVEDFEGEMGRLCAFLGLGWSGELGTFQDRVRSAAVATPSASQLSRGLNAGGIGQWRRYSHQLKPLMPILEPWVPRFGYDPTAESGQAARPDLELMA